MFDLQTLPKIPENCSFRVFCKGQEYKEEGGLIPTNVWVGEGDHFLQNYGMGQEKGE